MHTITLELAQVSPGGGSVVATVWDMLLKGGWVMVPLGLCSLAALTLVVERYIVTRRARVTPPSLLESLARLRHQPEQAMARCAGDPSPLAGVMIAAIKAADLPRAEQEKQISDAGVRELRKLRIRMRVLSALPQSATMLGLFGTVVGMIRTFTAIATSGESLGKTERLAQGIYEAWTATAAGLAIAIPTLLAYHLLLSRIDAAASALDNAAKLWLDGEGHAPTPAAPAPAAPASVAVPA